MKYKNNFFILTGAPGVGKTSLINHLRKHGYKCIDEPARKILAEQRAIGGSGLPEINPALFTELLLLHSIESYNELSRQTEVVIFDRGVVDSIGYAKLYNIDIEPFKLKA